MKGLKRCIYSIILILYFINKVIYRGNIVLLLKPASPSAASAQTENPLAVEAESLSSAIPDQAEQSYPLDSQNIKP